MRNVFRSTEGSWLTQHEKTCDIELDAEGRELLCPFCAHFISSQDKNVKNMKILTHNYTFSYYIRSPLYQTAPAGFFSRFLQPSGRWVLLGCSASADN